MSSAPPSEKRSILFVDDERGVRKVAEQSLKRAGFDVLAAQDGEQALELFIEHRAHIGLVILDLNMPGLGGVETLERLRQLDDQVRVVLSSGYDAQETLQTLSNHELLGFIQKPYRISTLIAQVERLLEPA